MENKQIREGDVLLVADQKDRPSSVMGKTEVILAEGEVTGHAHRLAGVAVYDWTENGQRYVRVEGSAGSLSHEEHDPTPAAVVTEGVTYQVIPQREWRLEGQWQKVRD